MIKSYVNRLLYVLLAVYCLIFFTQGSVAFRHYDSVFIFKAEVLFVLLSLLTIRLSGYKALLKSKFLKTGLTVWIIIWVALILFGFVKDLSFDTHYLLKIFHGVFAIAAIAVYQEYAGRIPGLLNEQQTRKSKKPSLRIPFYILCIFTFSVAISSGHSALENSNLVFKFQIVFIISYIFLLKALPDWRRLFEKHRGISVVFLLWVLSVTWSFLFGPYDISSKSIVYERYDQTITHAVFFVFVYEYLRKIECNKELLLELIPASVAVLAAVFVITWLSFEDTTGIDWFLNPPLNGHIRYTGYLATASSCVALAFALNLERYNFKGIAQICLLFVSLGLVLWTGGRAAIGSVAMVMLVLIGYLAVTKSLKLSRLTATVFVMVAAATVAETFKVFEWNGLLSQIVRTESSTSINSALTGRPELWKTAIESMRGHWLFGLGPQGYAFMPNRVFGLHPHNMIIQFIVEWGLVGASLFLVLLLKAGTSIVSYMAKVLNTPNTAFLAAASLLLGLSIHGFVDGTYYHGQPSYYIALALALCLSVISNHENEIE